MKVDKDKTALKRIAKSKTESFPDLEALLADRNSKELRELKDARRKQEQIEKEVAKKRREEAEKKSYDHIFNEAAMVSNDSFVRTADTKGAIMYEDDFM